MESIIRHVAEVEKEIVEKDATIAQLQGSLTAAREKISQLESREKSLEIELNNAKCENGRLSNECNTYKTQNIQLQAEIQTQRSQVDAAKAHFDEVVEDMMKEKIQLARNYDEMSKRFEEAIKEMGDNKVGGAVGGYSGNLIEEV